MNFNKHLGLSGKHAFLSPSSSAWLRYDDQKLHARYHAAQASRRGTDVHAAAHENIRLRIPLHRSNKALYHYVSDAIKYDMSCEQTLVYSENCYGTADTISFDGDILRIHDLKTGISKATFEQLEVYAALFCLEYGISPFDIEIILRLYQRDSVLEMIAEPEAILHIMDRIMHADNYIESIK